MRLTAQQERTLTRLRDDLPFYAQSCLKIANKKKAGELTPFVFNRAQRYVESILNKQLQDTGMVRAIVLKGRQYGGSTHIQGRFFHKLQFQPNRKAFILAHSADSTDHIFGMTDTFQKNLPSPVASKLLVDNSRELTFANGSSYAVGTAGRATVGRGTTVQYFHSSETAFYEKALGITTGMLQAVARVPNTESILESTANGVGNFFHNMWTAAVAGEGDYIPIFVPWYWQDEYKAALREDFTLTEQERVYLELFENKGLTKEHLQWRRLKLTELEGEVWRFMQEYPMTPEEAFRRVEESFYDMPRLYLAVERSKTMLPAEVAHMPRILGVDPGRTGDPTVTCDRQGRLVRGFTSWAYQGEEHDMVSAGKIARAINEQDYDAVHIDVGYGHGIIDRLRELGFSRVVRGVEFGGRAIRDDVYRNKRAEMAGESRDWFNEDVAIPDDKMFITEASALPREKETSNNLQFIVSKDILRDELKRSTNHLDAFWCTFAYPVKRRPRTTAAVTGITVMNITGARPQQKTGWGSGLRSLQGVRRGMV